MKRKREQNQQKLVRLRQMHVPVFMLCKRAKAQALELPEYAGRERRQRNACSAGRFLADDLGESDHDQCVDAADDGCCTDEAPVEEVRARGGGFHVNAPGRFYRVAWCTPDRVSVRRLTRSMI